MSLTRSADALLIRRTALRLGLQVAGLVALAIGLLIGLTVVVVLHDQATAADAALTSAIERTADVNNAPGGTWLTFARTGRDISSPGIPAGLPVSTDLATVAAGGHPVRRTVDTGSGHYRVLTEVAEQGVVQANFDLGPQRAERSRLTQALGLAALLGLVLAVVAGTFLGRRAVRPLAEALALQRRFVADASHELRTPLTLLSTRAQLLERGLAGESAGVRADAAGVVEDTRRLGAVIEDLLVAADPRAAGEPVDLVALAASVIASSSAYAAERGIMLATSEPATGISVPGQPVALRRALTALVDNAIEHSPRGGTVTIEVARSGASASLGVLDEGPGVDPELTHELVRRFSSGGNLGNRRHYGLGLALADEIASRHGGRLDITRRSTGVGSAFVLLLPSGGRRGGRRR